MDPEATLEQLREWAQTVMDEEGYSEGADHETREQRGAELFQALDQWLSRGAVLPKDWQ